MSNFILYRVDWNPDTQHWDKAPAAADGYYPVNGERNMMPLETAQAALARLDPLHYRLGFWFTGQHQLAFLDWDNCDSEPAAVSAFRAAGAFVERSTSGRGYHAVFRYSGELPPHSNRASNMEFYTEQRGMVFGTEQTGDWNTDCTSLLLPILHEHFPPQEHQQTYNGQRSPDWRGPEDDDELIRRMLSARPSAAAAFGNKASLRDLWEGKCEHSSNSDMALASHLAFWTGRDVDRVVRLMRRSGLVRPKWDEHRTYLKGLTASIACATCQNVYKEPECDTAVPDTIEIADALLRKVNSAGTYQELMGETVKAIVAANLPVEHVHALAGAMHKKSDLFGTKIAVSVLRGMLMPRRVTAGISSDVPPWAARCVFVTGKDKFYDTFTGSWYSPDAFRMEYSREMPMRPNGDREDPVRACRDVWNIAVVDSVIYRPDMPNVFDMYGKRHANRFTPASIPPTAESYSIEGTTAIQNFHKHIIALCAGRQDVATLLLQWLAHNVQFPGRKIRWAPIIKGVEGDGKSVIGTVMRAVMGYPNVRSTSNNTLGNSGGFTEWACTHALNVIEEIYLVGKERHKIFNGMKVFITDEVIDINTKGQANTGDSIWNPTNHIAFTNYSDAIPIDDKDRRWMVIFSPYASIEDAMTSVGTTNYPQWIGAIAETAKDRPGEFRRWFMSFDLSSFDRNGRAPHTDERERMAAASVDEIDELVVEILDRGGYGVHRDVFSSSCLRRLVKFEALKMSLDVPEKWTWNRVLTRLRYEKMQKYTWWDGATHQIWLKPGKIWDDHARNLMMQEKGDGRKPLGQ